MSNSDKAAFFEKVLAGTSEHDYIIMAGHQMVYGVDKAGNHRFLHISNKYEDGVLITLPLRLARRTCEWLGGEPVSYRTWLQVEIKRLRGIL